MNKDNLIVLRTSKELHKILAQVAKRGQRSLSSMIEVVLTDYLKEKNNLRVLNNNVNKLLTIWPVSSD